MSLADVPTLECLSSHIDAEFLFFGVRIKFTFTHGGGNEAREAPAIAPMRDSSLGGRLRVCDCGPRNLLTRCACHTAIQKEQA